MNSNQITSPNNIPKKPKKGCCIALVVAIIIALIILIYFVVIVVQNTRNLNANVSEKPPETVTAATSDDPYQGGIEARVVIVEFGDFQCPYCLQAFPIVREVISLYGDNIKFIYRDFPLLDDHPDAKKAAEAGECAHEQDKFWEMHDKMFINHNDLSVPALKNYAQQIGLDTNQFNNCLDSGKYESEVLADFNDGVDLGITGTPTFFINNKKHEGVLPLKSFKRIIDKELAR